MMACYCFLDWRNLRAVASSNRREWLCLRAVHRCLEEKKKKKAAHPSTRGVDASFLFHSLVDDYHSQQSSPSLEYQQFSPSPWIPTVFALPSYPVLISIPSGDAFVFARWMVLFCLLVSFRIVAQHQKKKDKKQMLTCSTPTPPHSRPDRRTQTDAHRQTE